MNRILFPILGLLLACSGATESDTGDTEPEYRDIDGDGYNERVDCDDYNSSVNPGQAEMCDGIDNNCDNLIDGTDSIDIITWYVDIDADGFGDEDAEPVEACDQPDGYVCALANGDDPCDDRCDNDRDGLMDQDDPDCTEDNSAEGTTAGERRSWDENGDNEPDFDCNDEDYMVHPGVQESCADTRDNDCDNIPDSQEEDAIDGVVFYVDEDLDGFGDDENFVTVCQQPENGVLTGGDCNDQDATVYWGAADLCDGQINDCSDVDTDKKSKGSDVVPEEEQDQDDDNYIVCQFPDSNDPLFKDCLTDFTACWDGDMGDLPIGGLDCSDDPIADPHASFKNPGMDEVCDGIDNDCDGVTWIGEDGSLLEVDLDGDGFVQCTREGIDWRADTTEPGGDDCWDANYQDMQNIDDDKDTGEYISAWVFPMTDSGGTSGCLSDVDGDGFGSMEWQVQFLDLQEQPDTWSSGRDCNDLDEAIHPDAIEICNTDEDIDEDCNGKADNEDIEDGNPVGNLNIFYKDSDGDSFGDELNFEETCSPSDETYVEVSDIDLDGEEDFDCDDSIATKYPEAPEICNDGIVNACPTDSKSDPTTEVAPSPCHLDLSATDTRIGSVDQTNYVGSSLASLGDITGDEYEEFLLSGWNADGNANGDREGAAWLMSGATLSSSAGVPATTTFTTDDNTIVFPGNVDGDSFGYKVANLGDIDGDELNDIGITGVLIGDHPNEVRTENGGLYIFLGSTLQAAVDSSEIRLDPDEADIWIYGEANYDELGDGLMAMGDLDNDGYDDFGIGCTSWDDADSQEGGVFIFYGSEDYSDATSILEMDVSQGATMIFSGDNQNDRIGDVFTGDVDLNADGLIDMVIGARNSSAGATNSGTVYVGMGPIRDTINASKLVEDLEAQIYGRTVDDAAGSALAVAGNLDGDGDGYGDIFIGSSGDDTTASTVGSGGGTNSGSIYLLYGSSDFENTVDGEDLEDVASASGAQFYGFAGSQVGNSIDASHDFDGDGIRDLLIGASDANHHLSDFALASQGVTYLVYGSNTFSGSYDLTSEAAAIFYGTSVGDASGMPVQFLGNVYGTTDGTSAIGIGVPFDSNDTYTEGGALYLLMSIGQ